MWRQWGAIYTNYYGFNILHSFVDLGFGMTVLLKLKWYLVPKTERQCPLWVKSGHRVNNLNLAPKRRHANDFQRPVGNARSFG